MKPELSQFSQEVSTLVAFVEGRLAVHEIESALNTSAMQNLFNLFVNPRYPASTRNFSLPHGKAGISDLMSSEDIVLAFLRSAGIECKPVLPYRTMYQLIQTSLPDYVDPPLRFLLESVLPKDKSISQSAMKQHIQNRIAELFTYSNQAPAWIKAAEWPIEAGEPAFFVGQIAVCDPHEQDEVGMAFLFFHKKRGDYETITQYY